MTKHTENSITYWDRASKVEETEQVLGESFVLWVYENPIGSILSEAILSRPFFSHVYGGYQNSKWSTRKIKKFVEDYRIAMDEYEDREFSSFNEFFIRRFKPGKRPFNEQGGEMPAFAEGRYFAFEKITANQSFPIKGVQISVEGILGGLERARPFLGGPLMIARLCPTDYHRYHYPDNGTTLDQYRLSGKYHSVNPIALRNRPDVFLTNERHVSILKTKNFGRLAYVEVGAMCVGRIVQTHDDSQPFVRGQEKGYFLFGGSTVILIGEPGVWEPDTDLLEQTVRGRETLIKLGDRIAVTQS